MDEPTPETKQERINPVTKQWEMLTLHEWKNLSAGLPKDSKVSDGVIAIMRGPEYATYYAFTQAGVAVDRYGKPASFNWLVSHYKKWWPRNPTDKQLVEWAYFMRDMYNLPLQMYLRDEAAKLQIGLLKTSIEKEKLKKVLAHAQQLHSDKFGKSNGSKY